MFEPSEKPRVFACPPGADFPRALIRGLQARWAGASPESSARTVIFVNTRRMQRRIWRLFDDGPALLLPRIRLITDLAHDPVNADLPGAVSSLRRRLELSQLVARLLEKEPDLAPRSAIFDLSDSLALLLAEMHDEGVDPQDIQALDVSDRSGHWQRSLKFLDIVSGYFSPDEQTAPDANARQRRVIERLTATWASAPPTHPVIVAGSTGSRGSTAMFMQAVARLPQGAVVLPGFDFDQPAAVWDSLDDALTGEDHPQYRFRRIMVGAGLDPSDVPPWDATPAPNPARSRLISLALRPAPVTNQWMTEGPALGGEHAAMRDVALIEAPSERVEAVAIALALRKAAENGRTAALVTPDRQLTRRVRAALDIWRIEPDVSVGEPLDQSAPGRLFRHVAEMFGQVLTSETLLAVLKHPLVNSGGGNRGPHLLWTRSLEMRIRRYGPPFPTRSDLMGWANTGTADAARLAWATWVADTLCDLGDVATRHLRDHLEHHNRVVCALASGPQGSGDGALWQGAAGQEAEKTLAELTREADHGGPLPPGDYAALFRAILKRGEVRDPVRPHPNIMIWGTLEARVQGADLVILGGLNDGIWPDLPSPDPWLNRQMRHRAGLLVPERRIGLSAHDFQQAIAARQVILTRSVRDAEAQTVPSRWLGRLTNLMQGMSDDGRDALAQMRLRGDGWLALVDALEAREPVAPVARPSPRPPLKARPKALSVTAITRLIRDPFAIYAQYVLRLRPLDPLRQEPDAPLRGTVLHKALEQFIRQADVTQDRAALHRQLMDITDRVLSREAPWPAARVLWRAKLARVADIFLSDEVGRQAVASPVALELLGAHSFSDLDFTLTAKADRIDRTPTGSYRIYDYKTGSPPTKDQLRHFDKQLLLEAVLAEAGAFDALAPGNVDAVAHIGLGATPKYDPVTLEPGETQQVRAELLQLISHYQHLERGYTSRRAMAKMRFAGDYDHLARFGEWDETQSPVPCEVGK
jgi:ATP-dependent helicase/nuclease subunit B